MPSSGRPSRRLSRPRPDALPTHRTTVENYSDCLLERDQNLPPGTSQATHPYSGRGARVPDPMKPRMSTVPAWLTMLSSAPVPDGRQGS